MLPFRNTLNTYKFFVIVHLLTAPVYKPAPSPYEARQVLTPDSSVKKYSFKIIEPAPKAAPEVSAEVPTAEINLQTPAEEERQSRLLINEIIPENDFDEEISTEGNFPFSFFMYYIFTAAAFSNFTHCVISLL